MDISSGFMSSIDLQNGVFEESGLEMLDKWEKEGTSILLGSDKERILSQVNNSGTTNINLDEPVGGKHNTSGKSQYSDLFDF